MTFYTKFVGYSRHIFVGGECKELYSILLTITCRIFHRTVIVVVTTAMLLLCRILPMTVRVVVRGYANEWFSSVITAILSGTDMLVCDYAYERFSSVV